MNRGDFRDRLKNYTEEPLDSDWSKMAQLLEINEKKKRRRPFFWKILGVAMLIGVVVGSALFFKIKNSPVILPEAKLEKTKFIADEKKEPVDLQLNPATTNQAQEENTEKLVVKSEKKSKAQPKTKAEKSKAAQSNDQDKGTSNLISPSNIPVRSSSTQEVQREASQNLITRSTTPIESSTALAAIEDKNESIETSDINGPSTFGLTKIASLPLSAIEFQKERKEEELSLDYSQKPEVKIYRTASNYLAVGLTASFPKVGLGDSSDPFLIPNQSLIPNLGLELGVGRKWSKGMSLEFGARSSYFQYRLSNVLSARSPAAGFADENLFDTTNSEASQINRHLIVSPYVRVAYDWDILESTFIGLYAAVGPNFVFELPSTNVAGLGQLELDTNAAESESIRAFGLAKPETSYELELGLTLGQKVLKTSQFTMNFSYGLTMGNLLSGTVFLEQNNESFDSGFYEVKANGPRFKLRYYF